MKVSCENIVRCGNYNCYYNRDSYCCSGIVVALDANGKCAMVRPKTIKAETKSEPNKN